MIEQTHPSSKIPKGVVSKYVKVEDLQLHYLEAGEKEVILMLHGFPTSAYLWRNIMPKLAETHRVIALDLPGYGKSDKPLSVSYSFNYYYRILDGFLKELAISELNLVVHDLGGPIGLLWAVRNPERIKRLVLLNTFFYPKFSLGVILFSLAIRLPILKNWLTAASGIRAGLRLGVKNKNRIKGELLANYQKPFKSQDDRAALKKSASRMSIKGFKEIEEKLPLLKNPIKAIYGVDDWILPKVANTMLLVKQQFPQTEITTIPNCGHFLQEDEPELISQLISDFVLFTNPKSP